MYWFCQSQLNCGLSVNNSRWKKRFCFPSIHPNIKMQVPLFFVGWIVPVSNAVMHMLPPLLFSLHLARWHMCCPFLIVNRCRVPFLQFKVVSFWSLYWMWHFWKSSLHRVLWAYNQYLPIVILNENYPVVSPTLFLSSTPVIFLSLFLTCIHFPIVPSVLPFSLILFLCLPTPAIHYCSLCHIPGGSLSSSIPLGEG